jgi:hypothetical protein
MNKGYLLIGVFTLVGCAKPEPVKIETVEQQQKVAAVTQPKVDSAVEPIHKQQEILIPRSVEGDQGRYYLVEVWRNDNLVYALSKRVGLDSVVYTQTETNCSTMQMREIGSAENSADPIRFAPTDWFSLVSGSSKSDLANFLCSPQALNLPQSETQNPMIDAAP